MFNSISKRFGLILILATSIALSGCGGGSGGPATGSVLGGLDAAKKLFNALRSNVISLGNKSDTGFLQTEAKAMSDDLNNLNKNGAFHFEQLLSSLTQATEMVSDVVSKNGKLTATFSDPIVGSGYVRIWGPPHDSARPKTCLYISSPGPGLPSATPARTVPSAGTAFCSYFSDPVTQVFVKVSTNASASATYNYENSSFTFASASCTNFFNANCAVTQNPNYTGSFDAGRDSSGWTSTTLVNGKLIPAILGATDTTANLNWTLASANGTDTVTVTGSMISTNATDSSKSVSVNILPNSKMSWTSATGAETATLIAQVKTGKFQYDGTFSATGNSANEFSINGDSASSDSFTGKISTVSGSTVTDFLDGTIVMNASGSATLAGRTKGTLSAKVLNGGAVSDISGTVDNSVSGQTGISFTYNFGGSYSLTASGTQYDNNSTPDMLTIISSDGTKIVVTKVGSSPAGPGSTSAKVYDSSGSPIGSIAPDSNQVNFVDGTYLLLL
ncbi:MAG: hypothetical protein PHQ05_08390 [Sterolibacterium sp.]|nr:hypothetical protein [Sterolibacterium sp.]